MCDPATAALIVTAASTGVGAINTNQGLRSKDRAAAEGIRRQGLLQGDASKRVGEQIEDIQTSTGESERADSLEGFLNAIRESKSSTEGGLDPVNAANPRFAERVAGGKARIATAGAAESSRLSRINAPLFQRQAESDRVGRTASDLRELGRQSSAEDFITQLRVAGKGPNAIIAALAEIGKGVGSVLALRPPTPAEAGGGIFGGGGLTSGGGGFGLG